MHSHFDVCPHPHLLLLNRLREIGSRRDGERLQNIDECRVEIEHRQQFVRILLQISHEGRVCSDIVKIYYPNLKEEHNTSSILIVSCAVAETHSDFGDLQ